MSSRVFFSEKSCIALHNFNINGKIKDLMNTTAEAVLEARGKF